MGLDSSASKALTENQSSHDDSISLSESDITPENNEEQKSSNEEEEAIAKAESKAVFRIRLVVLAVLVLSTVGVALAVYLYSSGSETEEFEEQFYADANKILEAIGSSLDKTLGAVDAFVVSMVSFARYSNSTWPFVTVPDFAVRSAKIRSLSNAVYLNVYPFVASEQRTAWEKYSLENDYWVDQGIAVQEKDETYYGPIYKDWEPYGIIHGDLDDMPPPGPYLPTWQSSPVIPEWPPYNWDLYAFSDDRSTDAAVSSHKVVIAEAYQLPDPNDEVAVNETVLSAEWFRDYIKPGEDPYEPVSDILYPILDTIDSVRVQDPKNHTFCGILSLSIFWRDMIKDILPPGSDGIVIVFENECNPTFSFQVNGPEAMYLGRGDLHDPKYDDLEKSSWLLDLNDFSTEGSSYTGIPVHESFCPFYLRLYPSDTMKSDYTTNNPIIFTVVAVLIFLFTSVVFLMYDCAVERRQKKVMTTAVQSTAIVSSLFPSTVRDRLFPTKKEQAPKTKRNSFDFNNSQKTVTQTDGELSDDSSPIADLFPNCTVLFADIAGFTAWSSKREPVQVFQLLETLFGAMDEIATRRGIFKVETIGDCYLAVTGLPQPRKDHAVAMAKFAHDCRVCMNNVTRDLEMTLGSDTGNLALRIGLHSGPVTAGVLRGKKSRFQLFGDTVNTAARMESNGQRNKIHVSVTTAELLTAGGKGHWITPRDDLVDAKGKGKMQTYWVEPKSNDASTDRGSDEYIVDFSERIEPLEDPRGVPISGSVSQSMLDDNDMKRAMQKLTRSKLKI